MALPTQVVPLPLVGGLDESVDPTTGLAGPGALTVLQNLVYDQAGAVVRRDGSAALSLEATDGVSLETIDHLISHGSELLAVGDRPQTSLPGDPLDLGPYLWSWSEALSQWAPRSQVPPATWTAEPAVTVGETIPIEGVGYICHAGGLEVTLWGVDGGGGTVSVRCRAVDVETGAVVIKDQVAATIDGRFVAFACGSKVVIVANDGTFPFKASYLDTATLAWSGLATVHSAQGNDDVSYWDACPIDSTHFAICYTATSTSDLWLVRVTIGASSTEVNLFNNAGQCTCHSDGDMIATAAVNLTAGRMDVWTNDASTLAAAVAGVEVMGNPTLDFLDRLSCCLDNSGRVWVVADSRKTIIFPTQMSRLAVAAVDSAGVSYSPVRYLYWISHLARPFAVGQRVYLPVGPSTYNKERDFLWGAALLDLASHPEDSTQDRPFALVGLLSSLRYQFWWTDVWRHVPFVSELTSSRWVFPLEVSTGQDEENRHYDRSEVAFGVQSGLWRAAPANGGLCLSGAVTSWYDGHAACELGFAHRPAIYSVGTTEPSATVGANTSYNYAVTWVWTDGAGLRHESEPSEVRTVALADDAIGVGGAQVNVLVHTLQITRKGDLQDGRVRRPFIRLYRTTNNDPTLYYLCAELDAVSDPSGPTVTITDSETDADLVEAARGILYTVGGRLEHQAPPPSSAVVQAKRRLWVASSVAPEVWFSGELLPGEGPWFHALQVLRLEGDEPITALATLDDKVIIFTASRVYAVSGEGPNDKGEGGFVGPLLVSSSSGCIDARSVVSWRGGVFFQSSEGLALLDRGLGVTYAGASVQTQLAAYPTITAASLDAARERIYWSQQSATSEGQVLWYDYGAGERGAWGTFRFDDDGGDPMEQRSLVVHGGALWRSHDGLPYRSASGATTDDGVWITAKVRTTYLAFASLGGAQRVRRFVVSGYALDDADWTFRSYFDESATASEETTLPESVHGVRETRMVVHLGRQRGSSVSLELEEVAPDPIPGSIGATRITGLGVEVGVMPGVARVIPSRRR